MQPENREFVDQVAKAADIIKLARICGLEVIDERGRRPKALCPFHDDHRPSLHFYVNEPASDRGSYHCFACGAHGDVFSLVQILKASDFRDALLWVAEQVGIDPPKAKSRKVRGDLRPSNVGLTEAERLYSAMSDYENTLLSKFAVDRGYSPAWLLKAGVLAASGNKLSRTVGDDRELLDALQRSGLIREPDPIRNPGRPMFLPMALPPRDLYYSDRVIFPIRSGDGAVAGFAGRSLTTEESPKYLFTKNFRKSDSLYRVERILSAIRAKKSATRKKRREQSSQPVFDLFLVEGFLDALRLESLGFHAVAILGSQLTIEQAKQISRLAEEADRRQQQLVVHIFLDSDDAGLNGMVSAVPLLLSAAKGGPPFGVDVVTSSASQHSKIDPDELLKSVSNHRDALEKLREMNYSALDFMLAEGIGTSVDRLKDVWPITEVSLRMRGLRFVERQMDSADWPTVLDRLAPFNAWMGKGDQSVLADWQVRLQRFILHTPPNKTPYPNELETSPFLERTDSGRLLHALQLAQTSSQRRELPMDEASWDRLKQAWEVIALGLEDDLKRARRMPEPMTAVKVPRGDKDFRLKAIGTPEDLVLQQYMLNELLKEVPSSRFFELIPAVRFQRSISNNSVVTTGGSFNKSFEPGCVSFAYQVDMDVVEGRIPPRREGMFRPYFDCWTDFISHIDRYVGRSEHDLFHVARLDIRRYYDSLPRFAVHEVLFPALRSALEALREQRDSGTPSCAKLFRPDAQDADQRARAIVDWLCNQSFGYAYFDVADGNVVRQSHERGVPQGPDLSAYLANIALFPLDSRLREVSFEHNAVYARYVDDMVIIAPSVQGLNALRSRIEDELSRVGLELSSKTAPLPRMRRDEVRNWLTDSRGGLGVSGPFAGPPITQPLIYMEPLADAGELDRATALTLLHDTRMSNPDTPVTFVLNAIRTVRSAENLRFGEQIKAASLLWARSISDGNTITLLDVVDRFVTLLRQSDAATHVAPANTADDANAFTTISDLLAALDGLSAFLRRRYDHSLELSRSQQAQLHAVQQSLAALIQEGLCDSLIARIAQGRVAEIVTPFRHMIALKTLAIMALAGTLNTPSWSIREHLSPGTTMTSAQARFLISLAEIYADSGLIDQLSTSAGKYADASSRLLFHEAFVRLSIPRTLSLAASDPMEHMRHVISDCVTSHNEAGEEPSRLLTILSLWLPEVEANDTSDSLHLYLPAACVFANIAHDPCGALLKRERLAKSLLTGPNGGDTEIVPSPSGIGLPGIMGATDKSDSGALEILRVDFPGKTTECYPPRDQWVEIESQSGLHRFKANLKGHRLLKPLEVDEDLNTFEERVGDLPHWIARSFTDLVEFCRQQNNGTSCPVTAFNLLENEVTGSGSFRLAALSHKVDSQNLIGQAFRRHGKRGLIAEAVNAYDGDLWRIGTALADFLGLTSTSRQQQKISNTAQIGSGDSNYDWIQDALIRIAMYRLRGLSLPAKRLPIDDSSELQLPATIERILTTLKNFPSVASGGQHWQRMAKLLAHLAENRAFATRFDRAHRYIDLNCRGAAAGLFVEVMRNLFRADETLADALPSGTAESSDEFARRPVIAWQVLGKRVRHLATLAEDQKCTSLLEPVIVGCNVMSVCIHLRMLALELWSLLEESKRSDFDLGSLDLSRWDLDGASLLHVDQSRSTLKPSSNATLENTTRFEPTLFDVSEQTGKFAAAANQASLIEASNVEFLFHKLIDATSQGATNTWESLAGVAPLGWCVIAGVLLGLLRDNSQRVLTPLWGSLTDEDDREFRELAAALALEIDEDKDVPWNDFWRSIKQWDDKFTRKAFDLFMRIDSQCDIHTTLFESPFFRISDGRRSFREVHVSDGSRDVPIWQIAVASAQRESSNRGTERFLRHGDDRWWWRWSETRKGTRLLSIGTVQPGMASLAGLSKGREVIEVDGDLPTIDDWTNTRAETAPVEKSPLPTVEETPFVKILPQRPSPVQMGGDDYIRRINRMQTESWENRRKADCHLRTAIFQWDADDSYRHPIWDACIRDQDSDDILVDVRKALSDDVALWTRNTAERQYDKRIPGLTSCCEHRRRKLLTAALEACRYLEVDVLLLPEYSVRPETIEWLRTEGSQIAPKTWVWAGTYRLPPYRRLPNTDIDRNKYLPWSAVLSIIAPSGNGGRESEVFARRKKYPSTALGEQFAPSTLTIKPLVEVTSQNGHLRSKTFELVCSEVFIVASPSNLMLASEAHRRLLQKCGTKTNSANAGKEVVKEDIFALDYFTSMAANPAMRRSILLVPAMTTRAVDYTVLGQANYLAAGLTTVFCNTANQFGCGQSCFIGHDGWDNWHKSEEILKGIPKGGPYHGVLPGIYCPFRQDRGWLGSKEQALVVADIDPYYSMEGRPRPQLMLPPLTLVAHLPVIESWSHSERIGQVKHHCRCIMMKDRNDEFIKMAQELFQRLSSNSHTSTVDDTAPEELTDVLNKLGELAEHSEDWLIKRRDAYRKNHAADPQPWPPPSALDWLWVNHSDTKAENFPRIEVPRHSSFPSEE